MKPPAVAALVVVAVALTVAVEEMRMAALRNQLPPSSLQEPAENGPRPARGGSTAAAGDAFAPRTRQQRPAAPTPPRTEDAGAGIVAAAARQLSDNPAAQSMMNQGVKVAVAMMYADFMKTLDLTEEEEEFFQQLLGKDLADQQTIGMQMLQATDEERQQLQQQLEQQKAEHQQAIATFLNNEEDVERFEAYQQRIPERQQIDGIRNAMAATNEPLDAATSDQLVDVMYEARIASNSEDLSGAQGIAALREGSLRATFEQRWAEQQRQLEERVDGLLTPAQKDAFREYQQQLKELQLTQIEMAEKMVPGQGNGTDK